MVSRVFNIGRNKVSANKKNVAIMRSSNAVAIEAEPIEWESSEVDALKIPLLSSEMVSKPKAKTTEDSKRCAKSDDSFIPTLVEKVTPKASEEKISFKVLESIIEKNKEKNHEPEKSEGTIKVAIFCDSREYFESFSELFNLEKNSIVFHRFTEKDIAAIPKAIDQFSGWIFNIPEEQDSPFLDHFLDADATVDPLFLFEPSPSIKCIEKVKAFIQSNQIN